MSNPDSPKLTCTNLNSYSLDEAVRYLKSKDKFPKKETFIWIKKKTGNRVSIGYN